MQDILGMIQSLKRPRLLIRAARHGVSEYQRSRRLRKLLMTNSLPRPGEAAMRLLALERDVNDLRIGGDGTYSVAHHVNILTALLGEARELKATGPQTKASGSSPFLRAT